MTSQFWKIGELAEQTGLTVRTLHHYDEIGLLSPSYRSAGDHRLYTAEDIAKLQQIVSLKQLGFTLEQIQEAFTKPEFSPEAVLSMHLQRISTQMKLQADLRERLEGMQRFLRSRGALSATEFLEAIRLMQEVEAHFSEEEMAAIRAQGEKLGKDTIVAVEQEWPQLIARAKALMDAGTDPASSEVQVVARRWKELVEMFTGGNPHIAAKLHDMYLDQPDAGRTFGGPGFDPKLFEYVNTAMAHLQ